MSLRDAFVGIADGDYSQLERIRFLTMLAGKAEKTPQE
ncbi:hypothetical protein BN1221_04749c [Brenneria goodwinii]|uniref:Uncharacterized protein n=1 Tax=Brenneria goodwinii TaxID=1109412 RepID=A0A0G4K233_9GAMM|nr:hypothetical protein BN1221_04749c [Brenneria goodwinii]